MESSSFKCNGVKEIVEIDMSEDEMEKFKKSGIIRECVAKK